MYHNGQVFHIGIYLVYIVFLKYQDGIIEHLGIKKMISTQKSVEGAVRYLNSKKHWWQKDIVIKDPFGYIQLEEINRYFYFGFGKSVRSEYLIKKANRCLLK
jgi:hypothetical protein